VAARILSNERREFCMLPFDGRIWRTLTASVAPARCRGQREFRRESCARMPISSPCSRPDKSNPRRSVSDR
jgi:hypothetical protein